MKGMEVSGTLMALGKAGQLSDAAFHRIRAPLMAWWAYSQPQNLFCTSFLATACNRPTRHGGLYLFP